jgi:hypothetical protein
MAVEKKPHRPGVASNFLLFRLSDLTCWLRLSPVGQVKQMLHFSAFVSVLMLLVRAIRHLFERMLGAANHLEH